MVLTRHNSECGLARPTIRAAPCSARSGGNAIVLERCNGHVTGNAIDGAADNALYCNDGGGLVIASNTIRNSGNGAIRVWQSVKRQDGSLIADKVRDDQVALPKAPASELPSKLTPR